ncbi:hypothetical protein RO3G_00644 [Lichtheimia corymbifera JMRC:FSU:9682]|uniref:Uncharacterized protein n=1 Tax=Lichtheimia corymbifera JMRC:FSU:9682 TaxID=1263082 RepID=A0A068RJ77_9FUNG|nr:hypothetical protein RO3G_00644 [Lichtheimia corymbifera JMRC:FSU:9682]
MWSLGHVCAPGEDDINCHCDWRVEIYKCQEETALYYIIIVNMIISALGFVLGTGIIYYRVIIKGHQFFEINLAKGCLRPKPIDSMLLLLTIFNMLRLVNSAVLISGMGYQMAIRNFLFEFPWQWGYGGFALYLIGIAQTLADSHKAISEGWLPSSSIVDFIGTSIFLAPFIINIPIAVVAGILALDAENEHVVLILISVHYCIWGGHCIALTATVMLAGIRLIHILNQHLEKINPSGSRYGAIKNGIFKIRAVMFTIAICLGLFALLCIVYGVIRDTILVNKTGNIFLSVVWTYLGGVASLTVMVAVILNPSTSSTGIRFGSKSSSNEKSTNANVYDTDYTSTFARNAEEYNTSMSRGSVRDELKKQQKIHMAHINHRTNGDDAFDDDDDDIGMQPVHYETSSRKSLVRNDIPLHQV